MSENQEKTQAIVDKLDSGDERTERIEPGWSSRPRMSSGNPDKEYDALTTRMDESTPTDDQEMTRIVGEARRRRAPPERDRRGRQDAMDDPPAGWLVIVKGPGKGNALTLGYGMNSIGRASGERVCLDFGDDRISRKGHASVTYDSRGRKFYVQQGGGTNLVYIEDEVILAPRELAPFTNLLVGETTLRFVPLCGESFDWADLSES